MQSIADENWRNRNYKTRVTPQVMSVCKFFKACYLTILSNVVIILCWRYINECSAWMEHFKELLNTDSNGKEQADQNIEAITWG